MGVRTGKSCVRTKKGILRELNNVWFEETEDLSCNNNCNCGCFFCVAFLLIQLLFLMRRK